MHDRPVTLAVPEELDPGLGIAARGELVHLHGRLEDRLERSLARGESDRGAIEARAERGKLAPSGLEPGAEADAGALIAHCKSLLAGYKVPREIRFEPIPKTSTGKIQKFQLRERARSAAAIDQE